MKIIKIIAEIGVNWDSLDQAKEMIRRSKEVGCFASKFQLFTEKEAPNLQKHLYLSFDQAKELFEYGKSIEQEVFFTPMYIDAIDICEKIGVRYYKVRNKDRYNWDILSKLIHIKKTKFISVQYHLNLYEDLYLSDFICLGVVTKYPSSFNDYTFSLRYGHNPYFNGISDHTPDTRLLELCLEHNRYEYFEKHVCLTKDCLESKWSITFTELEKVLKNEKEKL